MAKLIKKFLSTVLVLSSITGLSACQLQVSEAPIKIVESGEKEEIENAIDFVEDKADGAIDFVVEDMYQKNEIVEKPTMTEEDKILQHYSSRDQVEQLLSVFDADSDLLYRLAYDLKSNKQTIRRLEHNMGEPLTVAVKPNLSQRAGEIILEEVDKVFDIVGDINSNYKYEVVEYVEGGDFDIVFENRDGHWNGMVGFVDDQYRGGCAYTNKAIVYINERATKAANQNEGEFEIRNTVIHELMHVFGFGDVYTSDTRKIESTTLLAGSLLDNSDFVRLNITPNDFKNLVALYAAPSDNLENEIPRYQQMIDDYYQSYYTQWAAENFKDGNTPSQGLKDGTYTFEKKVYIDKQNKTRDNLTFELEVKDGEYILTVTGSNGTVYETTSGSLEYLNMSTVVNGEEKTVQNAIAIIEGFGSKYIHEDIYRSDEFDEARANIVLYYDGNGKLVLKDTLGNMNGASPEYQLAENELGM